MPGGFPRKVLCAIFYLSTTVFYKLLISPNGGLGSTVKHAAISAAVRGADVAVAVAVAVVAAVADTNRTVVAAACVCVVVVLAAVAGKMAGDPALTHARYFAYIRCVSMH